MRDGWRDIKRRSIEQGWRVEPTNGQHLRWISPEGKFVISAASPSDFRAVKNHLSVMKKYGFMAVR